MKTTLFFTVLLLTTLLIELRAQNTNPDAALNGHKKEFYPTGKLCKEYNIENGVLNGILKSYNEKGFLVSEQNFVNGIPDGIMKTFYENGKVKYENNFEDGKPQGTSKEYYENGNLKVSSYLTGEPWAYSGFTIIYFENGNIKSESKFSEGNLITATSYDKEGRITSEQKDGQVTTFWYENNGKRHVSINGVPQE